MREKIAEELKEFQYLGGDRQYYIDQILTLLREEIEKVENPYGVVPRPGEWNGFEVARQKILALLEEE